MNIESRKKALRFLFEPIVSKLGYKFTPSQDDEDFLLEQEALIEAETGIPYCPCQARSKNRDENMRMVCPCIPFHLAHYDAMRRCWCGLFVHKNVTDPDKLPQFPESQTESRKSGPQRGIHHRGAEEDESRMSRRRGLSMLAHPPL